MKLFLSKLDAKKTYNPIFSYLVIHLIVFCIHTKLFHNFRLETVQANVRALLNPQSKLSFGSYVKTTNSHAKMLH